MLYINQDYVDSYGVIIKEKDKTFVDNQRVIDNRTGKFYKPGIAMLKEEPSKAILFGELYDNVPEYEQSYLKLEAVSPYIPNNKAKLDLVNSESNHYLEYKKIKKLFNNGKVDENFVKKLVDPVVVGNHGWRDHNGASQVSISVFGDIEKLTTLPDRYKRASLLEIWSNDYYDMNPYVDLLIGLIKQYYNVDIYKTRVENLIHPYLNTCDIILTNVKGKK
jgi:hypothetical protein